MWTPEEGDGRYRVLRRLGMGGMAEVVLAQDTVLQRNVALKRVHAASDQLARKRLEREATVGASITHPNLVAVYDVWQQDGGEVFIVMEYVAGDTLQELIRSRGAVSPARALPILSGVAAGLDAVHARGIVHRDVKPGNILLGTDGSVKLTDLGIAAVEDRTRITSADQVLGTFSYMAPEQLAGSPPRPEVDIYALAAVAFEALSGLRAHPERNPLALAQAIATRPAPDLRTVRPGTPAGAAEVLKRGMSSDPARRPRTAGELIGRLREALEDRSTAAVASLASARGRAGALVPAGGKPPRTPVSVRSSPVREPGDHRRRRRLIAALALAGALVATGSLIAAFASGQRTRRPHTNLASAQAQRGLRRSSTRLKQRAARQPSHGASRQFTPPTPDSGAATSTTSSVNPASGSTATPTAVVQAFYEASAGHDYASAWRLADQNMRNQLEGLGSFEAEMRSVRTITFHQAQTVQENSSSATVSLDTTAVLVDRTQHCTGTVQTVRTGPGQWMLDHISISCAAV